MSKKRCAVEKVISILGYFHLVGLAEAKIHMFDWTELGGAPSDVLV